VSGALLRRKGSCGDPVKWLKASNEWGHVADVVAVAGEVTRSGEESGRDAAGEETCSGRAARASPQSHASWVGGKRWIQARTCVGRGGGGGSRSARARRGRGRRLHGGGGGGGGSPAGAEGEEGRWWGKGSRLQQGWPTAGL
jgi:hypothetical protein